MLSFFEMYHLMEGIEDFIARRKPTHDPNADLGQGTGQIRQNKNISKRVNPNWKGPTVFGDPVTQRDAELNRGTSAANQSPEDIAYRNMPYKRMQNPTGGTMSPDPDEDINPHGRMRNPALRGGMGAVGERLPSAPTPMAAKSIDKSPPSLQMLNRLHHELKKQLSMGGGNMTAVRGMYQKMMDLMDDAKKEVDVASTRNPDAAEQWIDSIVKAERFLKQLPGEIGLVRGESTAPALQWRYY